jgi:hypothetical protein
MLRRSLSLLITLSIVVLTVVLVFRLSDRPFRFKSKEKRSYTLSAVVIRDNVTPLQKLGSRLFTVPLLNKQYDHFVYFTQYSKTDKEQAFKDSLYDFLLRYDSIDIYLLAHGNVFYSWLDTFPRKLLGKVRLVYNTGCGNSSQAYLWFDIMGVKTYVAHSGAKSQSPVFYFYFLRRLAAGVNIKDAVSAANDKAVGLFSMMALFDETYSQNEFIEGSKALYFDNIALPDE